MAPTSTDAPTARPGPDKPSVGRVLFTPREIPPASARPAAAPRQPADLRCLQRPDPARPQTVDPDGTDSDPDEALDRRVDRCEHPAELAFPALAEHRLVPGEAGRRRWVDQRPEPADLDVCQRAQVVNGRDALVELDPPLELP